MSDFLKLDLDQVWWGWMIVGLSNCHFLVRSVFLDMRRDITKITQKLEAERLTLSFKTQKCYFFPPRILTKSNLWMLSGPYLTVLILYELEQDVRNKTSRPKVRPHPESEPGWQDTMNKVTKKPEATNCSLSQPDSRLDKGEDKESVQRWLSHSPKSALTELQIV